MLTNEEILLRLDDPEGSYIERKTKNDLNDCLKTVVALANSTPVGLYSIMFIGVRDNGEIEPNLDLDRLQKSVAKEIHPAYPGIAVEYRILNKGGAQFLAVLVPGSENKPHFTGPSYIRKGSQSVVASDAQFEALIAERALLPRTLQQWVNKVVTLASPLRGDKGEWVNRQDGLCVCEMRVVECNHFYLTVEYFSMTYSGKESYPLRFIDLSYDHQHDRLEIRLTNR